jgi:hypothetical protein
MAGLSLQLSLAPSPSSMGFVAARGAPCCPYTPESCVERRLSGLGASANKTNGSAARMKKADDPERLERSRMRAHLMERLQQGDADACRLLLDDVGPAVTRFLRGRVAIDEIEDVYQDIFMALFQARHTYEAGRPLEHATSRPTTRGGVGRARAGKS